MPVSSSDNTARLCRTEKEARTVPYDGSRPDVGFLRTWDKVESHGRFDKSGNHPKFRSTPGNRPIFWPKPMVNEGLCVSPCPCVRHW